jgi:non-specific protein-tyrosine kinase
VAFRRRWLWLIGPLAVFSLLAVVFTTAQPLEYQATAKVLLDSTTAQDAALETSPELSSRDLLNEINLANGDATTSLVRERLGLSPTEKLPKGIIEPEVEADVLVFTFTGPTAESAALTTNTWATAYVEVKQAEAEASVTQAVEQIQGRLEVLREQRTEIRADLVALEDRLARADETQVAALQLQVDREASAISGDLNLIDFQIQANIESITQLQLAGELASAGTARLVQNAAVPLEPTNASLTRNLAIGILIGALLGIGLALLVDNLDHSIHDAEDIQRMGLTLLGVIPEAPRKQNKGGLATVAQTHPGTTLADGYQKIRTALQFITVGKDIKTILVTSPQQGDGKTTTAANLALALANVESRVVLADIDFRRPQIHLIFNTELIPGISDALVGQTTLRQVAVNHPELSTTLVAMPAGTQPPNPATFLVSSRFAGLLSDLRNQADLTILDAPPVLPVADALSIASQVDGVILVVKAGETTHDELTSAVESIIRSGGQLLGVVVNHARGKATTYGVVPGHQPSAPHVDIVRRHTAQANQPAQTQAAADTATVTGGGGPMPGVTNEPPTTPTQPGGPGVTGTGSGQTPFTAKTNVIANPQSPGAKAPAITDGLAGNRPDLKTPKATGTARTGASGSSLGGEGVTRPATESNGNGTHPPRSDPAVTGNTNRQDPTIQAPHRAMPSNPPGTTGWIPPSIEEGVNGQSESPMVWPRPFESTPPPPAADDKNRPDSTG